MGKGKIRRLRNERRLISDLLWMGQRMPLAGLQRELDLGLLNLYRMKTRPRISWDVLMMRAYGLISKEYPVLRQAYTRLPWPHLYEHDHSVCMLTIAREFRGRERLFFARFANPERFNLRQLQEKYDHYRTAEIESIRQFRHQIRFARVPLPLRRLAWWTLYNAWPRKRASHMGTFGMSLSVYKNALGTQHLGPSTTTLGVDPHPRNGQCRLLLTFDHRVMDGKPACEIFEHLRRKLETVVTAEVKQLLARQGLQPDEVRRSNEHRLNRRAA